MAEHAEQHLEIHEGELEVPLVTFIELFLIEERYSFDREQAALAIFELAEMDTGTGGLSGVGVHR